MFHGAESHEIGDDGHHHAHQEANGPALDAVLELNGEWHAKEATQGVKDENSGGTTIYVSPGLRLSLDHWSSFVSWGIPVLKDLNGIQSEPDWRIATGAFVSFWRGLNARAVISDGRSIRLCAPSRWGRAAPAAGNAFCSSSCASP
jgi:hypothetical protein